MHRLRGRGKRGQRRGAGNARFIPSARRAESRGKRVVMHPLRRRGQTKERGAVEGDLLCRVGAREDSHVLSITKAKDGVRGGCSTYRTVPTIASTTHCTGRGRGRGHALVTRMSEHTSHPAHTHTHSPNEQTHATTDKHTSSSHTPTPTHTCTLDPTCASEVPAAPRCRTH